jgi:hypothetical protein
VTPDFDDLVGDVKRDDRERLLRVHDLLVSAGPPPELPPHLEAGPTLAMTLGGRRRRRVVQRRVALLAATIVVLLLAFLGGYIVGNDNHSASGKVLRLAGTAAAPRAEASLRIEDADSSGNWPMELAALGLPKLPSHGYYEVYLVRHGQIVGPCGSFVVKDPKVGITVELNAPYRLHYGDSWVVTRQQAGDRAAGPVVLKPVT